MHKKEKIDSWYQGIRELVDDGSRVEAHGLRQGGYTLRYNLPVDNRIKFSNYEKRGLLANTFSVRLPATTARLSALSSLLVFGVPLHCSKIL
jgi:hypothetical protein